MTQKQGAHLLLMHPDRLDGGCPGSDQVAHGFVRRIWDPHRRQFARPQQARERGRVTPVRLHSIARLARNERWRRDHTGVAEFRDQTLQPIACRSGLVTEIQPLILRCQLPD